MLQKCGPFVGRGGVKVKVVLASHSRLSQAMLEAAEMFLGKQKNVGAVGLFPGDSPEDFEDELKKIVSDSKPEEECLILCDLISGTPFNIASKISYHKENIKVIYGMNLPIVLEALNARDTMTLEELCEDILNMVQESCGIGKF